MGGAGARESRHESADARSRRACRSGEGLSSHVSLSDGLSRAGQAGTAAPVRGSERNYRIMLDNEENPYTTSPGTVYRWGRSRCLGGRTLHWARATDRMADYEFKAASRDGYGMDWAVSYADMKPYYDRVESFIGVSAAMEGMPQFPDGVFLPPMPLNCAETIFTAAAKSWAGPRRTAGWRS